MTRNDALNNEHLLPDILRHELLRVRSKLEADNEFGHIFNTERVRLWRAMDRHYGYHVSAMRRAVLAARVVWPLLPIWEYETLQIPGMIPSSDHSGMPRLYLASCTKELMGKVHDLDEDTYNLLMARIERLWTPEFEPLCLVIPAILDAGPLMAIARRYGDDALDELTEQLWAAVESGEVNEAHSGQDMDWQCFECHFWASEIVAGDLRSPRKNDTTTRREFWEKWLDDFVAINTRPIDELVADLALFID